MTDESSTLGLVCPSCGSSAEGSSVCLGCGLSLASPEAVALSDTNRVIRDTHGEIDRIDSEILALRQKDGQLRSERQTSYATYMASVARRQSLLAARRFVPPHHVPSVPNVYGAPAAVPRASEETSHNTVQNLLLLVGGLLLGASALAFTVFAWSSFDIGGRAVILSLLTIVALVVPIILRRKALTATAETVAVLGLVFVALDAYAAWAVGLWDVNDSMDAFIYAGLASTAIAVIGASYALVVRLRTPQVVSAVAAHAALPFYALSENGGALLFAVVCCAVVAADIALFAASRERRFLRTIAVIGGVATGILAALTSLVLLILTDAEHEGGYSDADAHQHDFSSIIGGGIVLFVLAGLVLLAGKLSRGRLAASEAALGASLLVWVSGSVLAARLAAEPEAFTVGYDIAWWMVTGAAITLMMALVLVVAPERWRVGGRIGITLTAVLPGVIAVVLLPVNFVAPINAAVNDTWSRAVTDAASVDFSADLNAPVTGLLLSLAVAALYAGWQKSHTAIRWVLLGVPIAALALPASIVEETVVPVGAVVGVGAIIVLVLLLLGRNESYRAAFFSAIVVTFQAVTWALTSEALSLLVFATIGIGYGAYAYTTRATSRVSHVAFVVAVVGIAGEIASIGCVLGAPLWLSGQLLLGFAGLLLVIARWFATSQNRTYRSVSEKCAIALSGIALLLSLDESIHFAMALTGVGLVIGLAALTSGRRSLGWWAIGVEVVGMWWWFGLAEVSTVEAYSLPLAMVMLAAGISLQRRNPALSSWATFGPAIAAAFMPSYLLLDESGVYLRAILLISAATAVMLIGAMTKRQAPFVLGMIAVLLVTLRFISPLWSEVKTAVPIWVPLALAGALLLGFGATWEKRQRDLKAMGEKIRSMQ